LEALPEFGLLGVRPGHQLVEDVEGALTSLLIYYANILDQVCSHHAANKNSCERLL
jgi:hypothetical protein